MTSTEAAWLAGFMDGEANIHRYLATGRAGRDGTRYPTWKLEIANTHFPTIDYCVAITGVGRIVVRKAGNDGRWRAQHRFQIHRRAHLAGVLRQVLPYLVTKRDVAQNALSEIESRL